jgi:hypothetical protein
MKMTSDEFNYIADLQTQAVQLAVVLFCRASIEPLDSQRRERLKSISRLASKRVVRRYKAAQSAFRTIVARQESISP